MQGLLPAEGSGAHALWSRTARGREDGEGLVFLSAAAQSVRGGEVLPGRVTAHTVQPKEAVPTSQALPAGMASGVQAQPGILESSVAVRCSAPVERGQVHTTWTISLDLLGRSAALWQCCGSALAASAQGVHVCSRCWIWPGVIWTCLPHSIHSVFL